MSLLHAGFFYDMNLQKSYIQCTEYLYGLRRFGIKPGLSRIRKLLKALDDPQDRYSCIHIAGTNGKGSVASGLSILLNDCGCSTGLYTSPHLIKFNERIQINNRPISDDEVVDLYRSIEKKISGTIQPTFFEYATAMAFYEFGRRKVDWAVIETGMGGRLDATNVIPRPALTIITTISLEHKAYLGNSIARITAEKGGIIKRGVPVVSGVRQPEANEILETIARDRNAPFYRLGHDFKVRQNPTGTFNYYGVEHTWRNLEHSLPGRHQTDNAALVLSACEILGKHHHLRISTEAVHSALRRNNWPGRLEIISRAPLILLDGAHNLNAARQVAKYLTDHTGNKKLTLVIGILDDKPFRGMLNCLVPLAQNVILTRPKTERAVNPERLFRVAAPMVADCRIIPDVGEAVEYAVLTASPDQTICIAGSLYLVGEAKAKFLQTPELLRPKCFS